MTKTWVLAELALFFCAFFLPGYLGQALGTAPGALTASLMAQSVLTGLPQFLLMAYVVIVAGGTGASRWGIVPVAARDLPRTALLLGGCFALLTPFVALLVSLPPEAARRLGQGFHWRLSGPAQIPLALLFGLTAGYREEFFFRAYFLGRMQELGVPAGLSVAFSTALFSTGHLYEGLLAVGITAALGLLLSFAWFRWRNLHVLAAAHGAYNTIVLCLGLLLRTLPASAALHIL